MKLLVRNNYVNTCQTCRILAQGALIVLVHNVCVTMKIVVFAKTQMSNLILLTEDNNITMVTIVIRSSSL